MLLFFLCIRWCVLPDHRLLVGDKILFVMGVNAYASMGLKKTMALLLAVVRIKMIQQ